MSAQKSDVLAKLDWYTAVLGKRGSPGQAEDLKAVRAAVAELIEASEELMPRNLDLGNTNVSDHAEVDLIATMGELRKFAAALANIGGAA